MLTYADACCQHAGALIATYRQCHAQHASKQHVSSLLSDLRQREEVEALEGGGLSRSQEGAEEVEVEMCRGNTGLEGIRHVSHAFQVKSVE